MLNKLKINIKRTFHNPLYIRLIVSVAISLILFIVYTVLYAGTDANPFYTAMILIVIYIVTIGIIGIIYQLLSMKITSIPNEEIYPVFGDTTLDLLLKCSFPVVVCDNDGVIVWYNKEFDSAIGRHDTLYGLNVSDLCGFLPADLMNETASDGIEAAVFDRYYNIKGYKLVTKHKDYCVTIWENKTELNLAYRQISDNEMIVAYIVIDNLDELMQYVQDKNKAVSSDVAAVLKDWAASVGGILKEYERDRFIFLFEARWLDKFTADKFEILDRIRDIRIGEGSLPVTVSMGISHINAPLAEKEKSARASLDMALQRGGDQVALKTDAGMDFYGGRTKTVQKRTKVRARVVANELIMLISKSSNVLIMPHRNADFDAIGACAGMARLSMFCGIKANIIANRKDPNLQKCFDKLDKLEEYRDIFVDSVSALDMIASDTLLIIVDVNNVNQFEALDVANNVRSKVVIDHHRKTAEFKEQPQIQYIEPSASSTCELISEILEQTLPSGTLTKDEAEVMFAGILLDTKQFSRNTGTRTFSAALYLRNEGANPVEAQELFKTNLDDFMREAKFESNVVIYRKIIAIAANDSDGNTSYDRIAAAKVADKLLTIDQVTASFSLCRIDNTIHISARSSGAFNVQIVLERLGGGGHYDSAATQFKDSDMADALTKLKDAIDAYLNEN